ncbi:hypothetical protein Awo_c33980 [Acetobacterium woodii DSM 1030]|uniref:Uncharacterized protein n=2 Tax=Acetobacterium woodii TaxID=33952 RepID=H6LBK1_ACEWD|nr:hypothetical protein Awo_c33980 [Acetobacterium woodii DSM 1030]
MLSIKGSAGNVKELAFGFGTILWTNTVIDGKLAINGRGKQQVVTIILTSGWNGGKYFGQKCGDKIVSRVAK